MRGATRAGLTRVRPAGLVFWVAFRSHRSRPLALLALLTHNRSSRGWGRGRPHLSVLARWPTTEILGRNDDPPILWVSGALPPNPQQGTAPPAPPLDV